MKFACRTLIVTTVGLSLLVSDRLLAVEEAEYRVIYSEGDMELREYAPSIIAETLVEAGFEDAGNAAFRLLFNYISGENRAREEIAMTAPVSQEQRSEKIAMTAPVSQRGTETGWAVSFMMPASYRMETIPEPLDSRVVIREIPAYRAAAVRYSGFWSEENYVEHLEKLRQWIAAQGLAAAGEPIWARYNAPFTPWFMRRNEILLPVSEPD